MNETETRLTAFDLPSATVVEQKLAQIQDFQQLIRRSLRDGHDYGVIPGTNKPTLLKPGAEKIAKLLGMADTYEIIESVVDWDRPLFAYTVRCRLKMIGSGEIVAEGLGECNSHESKYRWRQGERTCPECGSEGAIIKGKREFGGGWLCWQKKEGCGAKWPDGAEAIESQSVERVENMETADQKNTFLKMAKKRSLVDAALSVGRLSDLFTQDMEDLRPMASAVVEVEAREEMPLEEPQRPVQRSTAPRRPTPPPVVEATVREAPAENAENAGPSSLHVPEEITQKMFAQMCEASGWGQADVIGLLGSSAMEWIKSDSHRTYRTAWLACVEAARS
jgi:nitrite reductase/ring-hydroxylating ferredoxin subunit